MDGEQPLCEELGGKKGRFSMAPILDEQASPETKT